MLDHILLHYLINIQIWCGFDRASSIICGNKMPTRCNRWIFIADLIAYKPDTRPSAPHHTDNLKTKAPNTTGSNQLYNTLELLMMGIMVPETCWASNKICNKNHLLHLVGIYFHILTTMHGQYHFKLMLNLVRRRWAS